MLRRDYENQNIFLLLKLLLTMQAHKKLLLGSNYVSVMLELVF